VEADSWRAIPIAPRLQQRETYKNIERLGERNMLYQLSTTLFEVCNQKYLLYYGTLINKDIDASGAALGGR
jgi:hypothetical protein